MDVLAWLCDADADPAVRWQALRDLAAPTEATLAAERARVAREGLGARILAAQGADGAWHDGDTPLWLPTLRTLLLWRLTGVDPADPAVCEAIARLVAGFRWDATFGAKPFFEGEVEPCINGNALALGVYFGQPSAALVERLLGEQLADGGWNCEAPRSVRSSFHTTICVLEGLLAYERASATPAEAAAIGDARRRGEAYLLDRHLLRRLSTGEIAAPAFAQLGFPTAYTYNVLRGLDYLRAAGVRPDERIAEAVRLLHERRQPDGRWLLDAALSEGIVVPLDEKVGEPSRWITLRALRVLRWAAG
ncbi:MAG TPA: hypothetical protein VIX73_09125 [Kofleriaceae bacterium]|jgi:hypothetical protein